MHTVWYAVSKVKRQHQDRGTIQSFVEKKSGENDLGVGYIYTQYENEAARGGWFYL